MTFYNYGSQYINTIKKIAGTCPSCGQKFFLHNGLIPIHYALFWYDNSWASASEPIAFPSGCAGSGKLADGLEYKDAK